jgi:uncharacterized protein YdhG (YjbR/CyaY superfamily)
MSSQEVDEYVDALEEPKRGTLKTLRRTILEVLPEADEVISIERALPKALVQKLIDVRLAEAAGRSRA